MYMLLSKLSVLDFLSLVTFESSHFWESSLFSSEAKEQRNLYFEGVFYIFIAAPKFFSYKKYA